MEDSYVEGNFVQLSLGSNTRFRSTLRLTKLCIVLASFSSLEGSAQTLDKRVEPSVPGMLRGVSSPLTAAQSLETSKLEGVTQAALASYLTMESGGEFAIEAMAFPTVTSSGKTAVDIILEIDGPTVLQATALDKSLMEVFVIAVAQDKTPAGHSAEVFTIDPAKQGESIWRRGLKYTTQLDLSSGSYSLRIVLRSRQNKASAVRDLTLTVPEFESLRGTYIQPPFLSRQRQSIGWLPIRGAVENSSQARAPSERISPSARPVLVAGRRAKGHLIGYQLPANSLQGRIRLSKRGADVTGAVLGVGKRRDYDRVNFEAVAFGFDTPKVSPGDYELLVELSNGVASSKIPVVILPEGSRDSGLLWTDLRSRLTPALRGIAHSDPSHEGESESLEDPKAIADQQKRAFVGGYKQALAGIGPNLVAQIRLLDLESRVLVDESLDMLQAAQFEVVESLAKRDVESLLPVLMLHSDMYLVYRDRKLFSLASSSRSMAEYLADLYAHYGKSQGSRIVAARALASLAGYLQEVNLPSNSRRLYRRSLEYDAHNETALLGLATSFERHAEYTQAVHLLEELVTAHPDSGEALLRLSINLDRIGLETRAGELIHRLLDLETSDWVRSVAFQYLARQLIRKNKYEAAVQLLEQACTEVEDHQELTFLLAHVYDLQRRPLKALELIRDVSPESFRGESARKHYDSWPKEALERIRRELSAAASVRHSLVARTLQPIDLGAGQ